MDRRRIAILGSTGSIGCNALKVVDHNPESFEVRALSAYNNFRLLSAQIKKYRPKHVAVGPEGLAYFKKNAVGGVRFYPIADCHHISSLKDIDVVLLAMSGTGALMPFLSAVKAGKTVAPANKEALVIAGDLITREARRHGAKIVPVDSEQSAIFQCLQGQLCKPARVHLTASGGPLRKTPYKNFKSMTPKQILRHPRWKMGPKITVDSATLMNKGFEVIEAKHLFDLRSDQIRVLVHPEAIIHSMVEFCDGSLLAQLGVTDMRLPIQYALTYPERLPTGLKALDLAQLKSLNFENPDLKKFPCLQLAFEACTKAGTVPAVLNAADEVAVKAFLEGKIGFLDIYKTVEGVVRRHKTVKNPSLQAILQADQWARQEARQNI